MFSLSFTTSEPCSRKKDTYLIFSKSVSYPCWRICEVSSDQLFNFVLHYHFQSLVLEKLIIPHKVKVTAQSERLPKPCAAMYEVLLRSDNYRKRESKRPVAFGERWDLSSSHKVIESESMLRYRIGKVTAFRGRGVGGVYLEGRVLNPDFGNHPSSFTKVPPFPPPQKKSPTDTH